MPQRPGLSSFWESRVSPQNLSAIVPLALRAEASQKRRPCCVRRWRTEVTRTISHSSSPRGISGMGMLPRKLFQSFNFRSHSAGEHQRDHLVIAHKRPKRILERCLLYTSDAADERSSVDLGGRRIIK